MKLFLDNVEITAEELEMKRQEIEFDGFERCDAIVLDHVDITGIYFACTSFVLL